MGPIFEAMSGCCDPSGYRHLFNSKEARRRLRSYRRRGLDSMAQRLVDHLSDEGVEGSTVLEVGGGIGSLGIELIEAGASSAVNVEISSGYEPLAAELLEEKGLAELVDRRVGDFTDLAGELSADIVVMHRVVCCYPFMEPLMGAALGSTERVLAMTYPRSNPISRTVSKAGNLFCRLSGVDFQSYIHDPDAIVDVTRRSGFDRIFGDRNLVWHGAAFARG